MRPPYSRRIQLATLWFTNEQAISRLREVVRRQHKAWATESTHVLWLRRIILAISKYPEELSREKKLERFLTELARDRGVSAITQNQAFNAILFLYRDVLGQPTTPCSFPRSPGNLCSPSPGGCGSASGTTAGCW